MVGFGGFVNLMKRERKEREIKLADKALKAVKAAFKERKKEKNGCLGSKKRDEGQNPLLEVFNESCSKRGSAEKKPFFGRVRKIAEKSWF